MKCARAAGLGARAVNNLEDSVDSTANPNPYLTLTLPLALTLMIPLTLALTLTPAFTLALALALYTPRFCEAGSGQTARRTLTWQWPSATPCAGDPMLMPLELLSLCPGPHLFALIHHNTGSKAVLCKHEQAVCSLSQLPVSQDLTLAAKMQERDPYSTTGASSAGRSGPVRRGNGQRSARMLSFPT